ncbi:MAG: hypothetical protein Q9165_001909 [Trypethelium subeluteriae]
MAGKTTQRTRPLQRKRRRTSDINPESSQQSSHAEEPEQVASGVIVSSPSQDGEDHAPKLKKLRTRGTKANRTSIDETHQVSTVYNDVHEEEADGPDNTLDKHVHFSEHQESDTRPTFATEITSTLSRTSLSPIPTRKSAKRHHDERASLPPTLTGSPVSIQELHFSPLRTVIDERMRRRLRRSHLSEEVNSIEHEQREERKASHKAAQDLSKAKEQIKDLQLEVELQRQFGIDVGSEAEEKVHAMEDELKTLKQKMHEMEDQHNHDIILDETSIDDSDDAPNFVDPEDIPTSPLQSKGTKISGNGALAMPEHAIADQSMQISLPDPMTNKEREDFERTLIDINRKLSDAKSDLQILTIELSNIGFTNDGEDTSAIMVVRSIRDAFDQTRAKIEDMLPNAISNVTSNRTLLAYLEEQLHYLLDCQRESEAKARDLKDMNMLLKDQCNGLLDKVADMDIRKQMLETQWHELDVSNEQKGRRVVELDELAASLQSAIDERDSLLQENAEYSVVLERENQEQSRDLEKLRVALDSYRDEVKKLELLVSRREKDHEDQIQSMKGNHETQVATLNQSLETKKQHLAVAEAEIYTKTASITALELRLEEDGARVDILKAQLADAVDEINTQNSQRELAENEVTTKKALMKGLQEQIADYESNLEGARAELIKLKQIHNTERCQRESAEAALDDANEKVTRLENDINHRGVLANELRQKIFELQVAKEEALKELNTKAAQVENGLRQDLGNETKHRKELEQRISDLEDEKSSVESDLATTEHDLSVVLAEKEDIIHSQAIELNDLGEKHASTISRLNTITADLETLKKQNRKETSSLRADLHNANTDINTLTHDVAVLEHAAQDTATLNTEALRTRDEHIGELKHALDNERESGEQLRAEKASLERRVEAEAEAMLESQNKSANAMAELRKELAERGKDVEEWKVRFKDLEAQLDAVVKEKDAATQEWKDTLWSRDEEIEELGADNRDLKTRLVQMVERSNQAMTVVQQGIYAFSKGTGQESSGVEVFGHQLLQGLDLTDVNVTTISRVEEEQKEDAKLPDLPHVQDSPAVRKVRRSAKKMMRDSGVGMASSDSIDSL